MKTLLLLDPKLPLRLSEDCKIPDFVQRDLAIDFQEPLGVVDKTAKAVLGHAAVKIEAFDELIIGRGGHFFFEPVDAHQYRNRSVAILAHVTVGLDSGTNNPLDLIGFFFEFFHANRQSAEGVGKKIFRPDHDGETHLPTDIFGRNSGHCRVQQPLTHSDITPFARAARNEFHILVWIEAKVLNHQPPDYLGATAIGSNPDGFPLEVFDRFKLWTSL